MTVWGITRSVVTMETACPYVDYYRWVWLILMGVVIMVIIYRQFIGLQELMESCDYVCSILPSTIETRGLLTEEHFKYCSKKVVIPILIAIIIIIVVVVVVVY